MIFLRKFLLNKYLVGAGTLIAFALLGSFVRTFLSADLLARYKTSSKEVPDDQPTIFLKDVEFKQYQEMKLVSRAHISAIDITKDRRTLRLHNIDKGTYYGKKNQTFDFEVKEARWDARERILWGSEKVRVKNKKMDLTTDQFTYKEEPESIEILSLVKGRFYGGDLEAYNLNYQTASEAYTTGPILWTGYPDAAEKALDNTSAADKKTSKTLKEKTDPANPQEKGLQQEALSKNNSSPQKDSSLKTNAPGANKEQGSNRKKWTIKADSASKPPGDIETWKKGEATDGEIIVLADQLVRNVKTDVLIATGNVRYFSKDVNLLCNKATIYRKDKYAILEEKVQGFIKPKKEATLEITEIEPIRPIVPSDIAKTRKAAAPNTAEEKKLDDEVRSSSTKRKYPVTLLAQKVDYWYQKGERRAVITGSPQAHQDLAEGRWRHLWTHTAYYDGEKETLRLQSSEGKRETRVKTSIGDDLTATWFQISTKEKDEVWEGSGIAGEVFVDPEDEENETNSQAK